MKRADDRDDMLSRLKAIDEEMRDRVHRMYLDQMRMGLNPMVALTEKGSDKPPVSFIR